MFDTESFPLSAGKLGPIVSNDLIRNAKPIHNTVEKLHNYFHTFVLDKFSFHPLGERINPDEKEWYEEALHASLFASGKIGNSDMF